MPNQLIDPMDFLPFFESCRFCHRLIKTDEFLREATFVVEVDAEGLKERHAGPFHAICAKDYERPRAQIAPAERKRTAAPQEVA